MALFRSPASAAGRRSAPTTAQGERIYVIGDVHGCTSALKSLLGIIDRHQAALPPATSVHLVLLGDMIDRGTDAKGTLRLVHSISVTTDRLIVLCGNHERMMVRALAGEKDLIRPWLRTGGEETLRSFGIVPSDHDGEADTIAEANRVVPRAWLDWMRTLPLTARSGDYFFCHAGVRPGVALKKQVATDLLWIREEFLDDSTDHGAIIVHGHTPVAQPEFLPNRINLDTGAYRTGVLTALYLEGAAREVLQVGPSNT